MKIQIWERLSERHREVLVSILVVLSVFFSQWLGFDTPIRAISERIGQPIVEVTAGLMYNVFSPVRVVTNAFNSQKKYQQLERQYTEALVKISSLETIEKENQELRKALDLQSKRSDLVVTTPITSYGVPQIAFGAEEGMVIGDPILAEDVLIGMTSEVSAHQSAVTLLHQPQYQPILVSVNGELGLVKGDGKKVILTELPVDADIELGASVTTVGQQNIPSGILVGTVQNFLQESSDPVLSAVVAQPVSWYEVSIVGVLP